MQWVLRSHENNEVLELLLWSENQDMISEKARCMLKVYKLSTMIPQV